MKLGPGLSFSWKRALGVTKAKRRVSKKMGIPMSASQLRPESFKCSSTFLSASSVVCD